MAVELSGEEIEELFNMRLLLEPFLFARSAPHLTADDFKALAEVQKRYAKSIDDLEIGSWNALNTEFHLLIYRHARSARVTAIVQNLLAECDRHTRIQLSQIEGDRQCAVEEHVALLRLCGEGRYEEGAQLLRAHIDHIRGVLVELLDGRHEKPATP